jgi:hypothetical protein
MHLNLCVDVKSCQVLDMQIGLALFYLHTLKFFSVAMIFFSLCLQLLTPCQFSARWTFHTSTI